MQWLKDNEVGCSTLSLLLPLGMGGEIWVPTNLYFLRCMIKEFIMFFYSLLYLFKIYFMLMDKNWFESFKGIEVKFHTEVFYYKLFD